MTRLKKSIAVCLGTAFLLAPSAYVIAETPDADSYLPLDGLGEMFRDVQEKEVVEAAAPLSVTEEAPIVHVDGECKNSSSRTVTISLALDLPISHPAAASANAAP